MALREFPETRGSLLQDLREYSEGATWREFFDLYAPAVQRVAILRGLRQHDADDVVQQVMISVLAHIKGFEYRRDRGKFRAWIRRITENKINDLFRKRARDSAERRTPACEDRFFEQESIDNLWEEQWRHQDLRHCLELIEENVSPRRMEAFRLYVLQGVPAEETAERLGMTTAHVYVVRSLVLSLLRERLRDLDGSSVRSAGARARQGAA